jgi:hypothetical protein
MCPIAHSESYVSRGEFGVGRLGDGDGDAGIQIKMLSSSEDAVGRPRE